VNDTPTVFVIDDDESMRAVLQSGMESIGLAVETYPSAQAFLDYCDASRPGCLVLDMRMPGMSGLELQETLKAKGVTLPVIFLTGHGDVTNAVRAMRQGAVDFMEKPFNVQVLLDLIQKCVKRDSQNRQTARKREPVLSKLASLTRREREVMDLIVTGASNRETGLLMGISPKTVEVHRSHLMLKMEADSFADLVQMSAFLKNDQETP
jgi:two-component system response regulator FixJ